METQKKSDILEQLPVDKINPTPDEINIMNTLFTQHKKEVSVIFTELKDCLIIAILFILFSIPQLDDLIKKFIPITRTSFYILLLIKVAILIIIYWFIKHFYLAKK
jgi:hypothetical protein